MTILPEKILFDYLNFVIRDVKTSIEENENDNYIIDIFGKQCMLGEDYDMTREATKLFTANEVPFDCKIGFNLDPQELHKPLVLIIMPNEQETDSSIGQEDENEDYKKPEQEQPEGTIQAPLLKQKIFQSRYSFMIIAPNADLVVILYRVLQAMFMLYQDKLEVSSLLNIRFSGNDLTPEKQIDFPPNIYTRLINFDFKFPIELPYRIFDSNIKKIEFTGTPLRDGQSMPVEETNEEETPS